MTLVEELLKSDPKKFAEKKTGVFLSHRFAEALGKETPVEIELTEISQRALKRHMGVMLDREGNPILNRSTDSEALICVEGVVNPSLKDKKLQEHFSCATSKDLAEKLFGRELSAIASEIQSLSSYDEEEEIRTVKN